MESNLKSKTLRLEKSQVSKLVYYKKFKFYIRFVFLFFIILNGQFVSFDPRIFLIEDVIVLKNQKRKRSFDR